VPLNGYTRLKPLAGTPAASGEAGTTTERRRKMGTGENLSTKAEYELIPVSIRPKGYFLDFPLRYQLLIFGMAILFTVMSFYKEDIWWLTMSMFLFLMGGFWRLETKERKRRAIYLESYPFPSTIKDGVRKRYPFLSDEQLALVLQGLRQYFQLCNLAGRKFLIRDGAIYSRIISLPRNKRMLAMPSRVVDAAWHEFILTTRLYQEFCKNGIGRFLHHTPTAAAETPQEVIDGWKEAWRVACEWEEIDQQSPSRLPFLFAIDTALDIPDGFKHSLNNDYATEEIIIDNGCGCG
jgi:hypothetical protein